MVDSGRKPLLQLGDHRVERWACLDFRRLKAWAKPVRPISCQSGCSLSSGTHRDTTEHGA